MKAALALVGAALVGWVLYEYGKLIILGATVVGIFWLKFRNPQKKDDSGQGKPRFR